MSEVRLHRADGTVIILEPGDTIVVVPAGGWASTTCTPEQIVYLVNRSGLDYG